MMRFSIGTIVFGMFSAAIGASLLIPPSFTGGLNNGIWRVVFIFSVAIVLSKLEKENAESPYQKWIELASQFLLIAAAVYCIVVMKMVGWDGKP